MRGLCSYILLLTTLCVLLIQKAQPIRLLLKYTGTEFEDVKYGQWEGSAKSLVGY